jgi:hypothetical protein
VVAAHRFIPTDQAALSETVRATAADLRRRGLHADEHVRRGEAASS